MQRILWIVVLITLVACKREKAVWETDWKLPVGALELGPANLVGEDNVNFEAEDVVHLMFKESLLDLELDTLIGISDTTLVEEYVPDFGGTLPFAPGTTLNNSSESNVFDLNGVLVRQARIRSGKLNYSVQSSIEEVLLLDFSIPGINLNADPVSIELQTQAASNGVSYTSSGSLDVSGFVMDFTGSDGNSFNVLSSNFEIQVSPDAEEAVLVGSSDLVRFDLAFDDLVIDFIFGYFGEHEFVSIDTVDIDRVVGVSGDHLLFEQVELGLEIDNGVGVDAQLKLNGMSGLNAESGSRVDLQNDIIGQTINVARATRVNEAVNSSTYNFVINEGNSNIIGFIDNLPNRLILDVEAKINPLGNVAGNNDFLFIDNPLEINLTLDAPLAFAADNLVLSDTLDLTNEILENVAAATFEVAYTNTFEFGPAFSLDIVDSNGAVISTIAKDKKVELVAGSFLIDLSKEQFAVLNRENKLVVRVKLDTENYPDFVRIQAEDRIKVDIKMGLTYQNSL